MPLKITITAVCDNCKKEIPMKDMWDAGWITHFALWDNYYFDTNKCYREWLEVHDNDGYRK